jgi:arylsulfatase A
MIKEFLIGFSMLASGVNSMATSYPNIILIYVDDLGYGSINLDLPDSDVFNNPLIQTPNLQALAKKSLVLTSFYSPSPVCSPSRAGMLTGRIPTRLNINNFIDDHTDNDKVFLQDSEITIAEVLKEKGYQTAIFGKWHLNGADWEDHEAWTGWTGSFPKQQGFDEGMVTKENPHFTTGMKVNTQKHPGDFYSVDGLPLGPLKGYTSDIIADSAIQFMKNQSGNSRPFFLYLPFDAVHVRIAAADRFEAMYNTGDPRKDAYYANITHLDHAIGKLVAELNELNINENTVIFFTSDNGPAILKGTQEYSYFCYGTSHPLRGAKFQVYEGGVRVPALVSWQGKIKPGISDIPCTALDLFPTFCEWVQSDLPDDRILDGTSLSGYFLDQDPVIRKKPIYWQYEYAREFRETFGSGYETRIKAESAVKGAVAVPRVAIRSGDYVLLGISSKPFSKPEQFELYNVVNDPSQEWDISESHAELLEKMMDQLLFLYKEVNAERIRTRSSPNFN